MINKWQYCRSHASVYWLVCSGGLRRFNSEYEDRRQADEMKRQSTNFKFLVHEHIMDQKLMKDIKTINQEMLENQSWRQWNGSFSWQLPQERSATKQTWRPWIPLISRYNKRDDDFLYSCNDSEININIDDLLQIRLHLMNATFLWQLWRKTSETIQVWYRWIHCIIRCNYYENGSL